VQTRPAIQANTFKHQYGNCLVFLNFIGGLGIDIAVAADTKSSRHLVNLPATVTKTQEVWGLYCKCLRLLVPAVGSKNVLKVII